MASLDLNIIDADTSERFNYTFTVLTEKLIQCFSQLTQLYKGREAEKVIALCNINSKLMIESSSVMYYAYELGELDPDITEFRVALSFTDLSTILDKSQEYTTIQANSQYVTFITGSVSTVLKESYSIVPSFLPLIQTIEFEEEDCTNITATIKRISKLRPILKDYPQHQSIHCAKGYAYIATPVMLAYVKNNPISSTMDMYSANLICLLCSNTETIEIGYLSNYFCIHSEYTYLLVPRTDYELSNDDPRNVPTNAVCTVSVTTLKRLIGSLKYRCNIELSFFDNSISVSLDNQLLSYKNSAEATVVKKTFVTTDALYLASVLTLFDDEDIVNISVGTRQLVMKTPEVRVFLSCLS